MARIRRQRTDASARTASLVSSFSDQFGLVDWSRTALLEGNAKGALPWRSTRWRWLLSFTLVPLLALGTWWGINHIEGDVEQAAIDILERNQIDTLNLTFDATYRNIEVGGVLPAGTDAVKVKELLESGVAGEKEEAIRQAEVSAIDAAPVALGAINVEATSNDGLEITLTGTVPSQDDKDSILAAVSAAGLEVVSEDLTVSGLDPSDPDALDRIDRFSTLLRGLTAGSFSSAALMVTDADDISGTVNTATLESAADLQALAQNRVEVISPTPLGSLATDINFDGTRMILEGTVLSEAHAADLATAAAGVVGRENVVNNLVVSGLTEAASGADDRIAALGATIATFAGLNSAGATMNDTDLTVNGEAIDDEARAGTLAALAETTDAGLRPGGEIDVAEPLPPENSLQEEIDLLQAELDSLEEEIRQNVVFETDSNELAPLAQTTLDKVVDAMNRYPRPVVEVGGHTDSEGPDIYNLDLSQRRADAVAAYVATSIGAPRLRSVGFGESIPIADNSLANGRLQNRRVEFIAKESF